MVMVKCLLLCLLKLFWKRVVKSGSYASWLALRFQFGSTICNCTNLFYVVVITAKDTQVFASGMEAAHLNCCATTIQCRASTGMEAAHLSCISNVLFWWCSFARLWTNIRIIVRKLIGVWMTTCVVLIAVYYTYHNASRHPKLYPSAYDCLNRLFS